jgi:hypothetical protein
MAMTCWNHPSPLSGVADIEQPDQPAGHPRRLLRLPPRDVVGERGREIVVVGLEAVQGFDLAAGYAGEPTLLLGEGREVAGVSIPRVGKPTAGDETVPRVLAQRLQQAVAVPARVGLEHRLVRQLLEQVQGFELVAPGHAGGSSDVEVAGENAEQVEQVPFVRREQLVRPVDGTLERLLAGDGRAPAPRQQAEPLIQAGSDLLDRHHLGARRGKLDGQRDPVEAAADLYRRGPRSRVERKGRPHLRGPLGEERDGITRRARKRVDGERGHPPDRLAMDAEGLPARGEDPQAGRRTQQPVDQLCGAIDHVLAVVEHEQRPPLRQKATHDFSGLDAGRGFRADRGRDRRGDERSIDQGGELGEPHTAGELVEHARCHLDGEAGLAHAADSGQRHRPGRPDKGGDGPQLTLPPEKAVRSAGRFVSTAPALRNGAKSPVPTWKMCSGVARPARVCSPRSVSPLAPATDAVAADIRTWPPWPAAITRAARLTAEPK